MIFWQWNDRPLSGDICQSNNLQVCIILPPFFIVMPISQHPIKNRWIKQSPWQHVFFFSNLLHSDVHHNKEEKICYYFRFINTLSLAKSGYWLADSGHIFNMLKVCMNRKLLLYFSIVTYFTSKTEYPRVRLYTIYISS